MPPVHTEDFRVRHYECDGYGHVNHANYLRYMQEAAFGASAAVGFTSARYESLDLMWMAYETDIEYLQPLLYGDTATIRTWVHDFRRVRSLRHYEIFNQRGELCARGHTDWVLIQTSKMTPTTIPPEVVAAYADGDTPIQEPRTDPMPNMPMPQEGVYRLRRRVEWRDIDPVAHVNNAVYLHYAEDCGMQFSREMGWSMERLREMGIGNVARRHFIEYKLGAVVDDEIEISTWLSHMRRASAVRYFVLTRVSDGKTIARIRTLGVWVDFKTGEPARIPDAYKRDVEANTVTL